MPLSDLQILNTITESTTRLRRELWLRNIEYNARHFGFMESLKELEGVHVGRKSVVLAAGPGFKRFGLGDLRKVLNRRSVVVISCDGALPLLSELGHAPDYVVSVDGDPDIAGFYRRSRNVLDGVCAILATSVHRSVVKECLRAGSTIRWIQPFFKSDPRDLDLYRKGATSLNTGGNVGTTSYIIAAAVLRCSIIGLMGLEFSWSDETPLTDTQYFEKLVEATGGSTRKAAGHYIRVLNRRDGRCYVADPVYYSYFLALRDIWGRLPRRVRRNTYNLTRQGILQLPGLRYTTPSDLLRMSVPS